MHIYISSLPSHKQGWLVHYCWLQPEQNCIYDLSRKDNPALSDNVGRYDNHGDHTVVHVCHHKQDPNKKLPSADVPAMPSPDPSPVSETSSSISHLFNNQPASRIQHSSVDS